MDKETKKQIVQLLFDIQNNIIDGDIALLFENGEHLNRLVGEKKADKLIDGVFNELPDAELTKILEGEEE